VFDDSRVRVVPFIANAIFGTTMILVVECPVGNVLRDGPQPLRYWAKLSTVYVRAVGSSRPPSSKRPLCLCGQDRPCFRDKELGFMARDLEHISNLVSRQVHSVDAVRQALR
jgi:hypothetical protein